MGKCKALLGFVSRRKSPSPGATLPFRGSVDHQEPQPAGHCLCRQSRPQAGKVKFSGVSATGSLLSGRTTTLLLKARPKNFQSRILPLMSNGRGGFSFDTKYIFFGGSEHSAK